MTLAMTSPSDFCRKITEVGLQTDGGPVRLRRYLSHTKSNGGSDTAIAMMNLLDTAGMQKNNRPSYLLPKRISNGQGYPEDFVKVWNWMFHNLDDVRRMKLQTYSRADKAHDYARVDGKSVLLSDVFKPGRPFNAAIEELVELGCWGWDCVGFVLQYLLAIGHLKDYQEWDSSGFVARGGFVGVSALDAISPLCLLVFGGWHVAIVDKVLGVDVDDSNGTQTARVSIVQSYGASGGHPSGPHARDLCTLTQGKVTAAGALGPIMQSGVISGASAVTVVRHPDLTAQYPPYAAARP